MSGAKRRFPVLGGGFGVPWAMVAPHEPQARDNHGQTLQRLAERGGLSWAELLCVLESRRWRYGRELSDEDAKPKVLALVEAYDQDANRRLITSLESALAAAQLENEALRRRVEAADKMRSWYDKQMGPEASRGRAFPARAA
jgi:hypothetical protein